MKSEEIYREIKEVKQKLKRNQGQIKRIRELIGWDISELWKEGKLNLPEGEEATESIIHLLRDLSNQEEWDRQDRSRRAVLSLQLDEIKYENRKTKRIFNKEHGGEGIVVHE